MIRPLRQPAQLGCTQCVECQARAAGQLGFVMPTSSSFGDWKTWALIGAAALALYLLLQSTPKAHQRAVARQKARARYKAELARIREEY